VILRSERTAAEFHLGIACAPVVRCGLDACAANYGR
jgi:hypothetical protein